MQGRQHLGLVTRLSGVLWELGGAGLDGRRLLEAAGCSGPAGESGGCFRLLGWQVDFFQGDARAAGQVIVLSPTAS